MALSWPGLNLVHKSCASRPAGANSSRGSTAVRGLWQSPAAGFACEMLVAGSRGRSKIATGAAVHLPVPWHQLYPRAAAFRSPASSALAPSPWCSLKESASATTRGRRMDHPPVSAASLELRSRSRSVRPTLRRHGVPGLDQQLSAVAV